MKKYNSPSAVFSEPIPREEILTVSGEFAGDPSKNELPTIWELSE